MPKHHKRRRLQTQVKPVVELVVKPERVPWKDCFDGAVKFCLVLIAGWFILMGLVVLVLSRKNEWSTDYVQVESVEQLGDKTVLTFAYSNVRYTPPGLIDSAEVEGIAVGDWVVVWMKTNGLGSEKVVKVEVL